MFVCHTIGNWPMTPVVFTADAGADQCKAANMYRAKLTCPAKENTKVGRKTRNANASPRQTLQVLHRCCCFAAAAAQCCFYAATQ